jgi:hypothetical protein
MYILVFFEALCHLLRNKKLPYQYIGCGVLGTNLCSVRKWEQD